MLGRVVRLVADAEAQKVRADTQKTLFLLGGDTGLRGYAIGALAGTSVAVAHVELRSAPLAIRSQRVGGLLFYDVGDAASAFDRMYAKHDFGLGLRWLIPQLNSSVIRLDWAIATQRAPLTRPGLPGRVTAGFQQIF
jgi:outer membrane translocation and assembly module TamA